MQRCYHASSTDFRTAAEILFIQFLLLDAYTRREFEGRFHPAQSKLFILLNNLLMRVLLLDRVGRLHRFYKREMKQK